MEKVSRMDNVGLLSQLEHPSCLNPNCQYKFYDVAQLGSHYTRLPYCKRILLECAVRKSLTVEDPREANVWKATIDRLLLGTQTTDELKSKAGHEEKTIQTETAEPGNLDSSCHDSTHNIMFHPGRVVLQDFTGVAALVDLAALRDTVASEKGDPLKVDSQCPADLVVDNFVQVNDI